MAEEQDVKETIEGWTTVVEVELNARSFVANGKTYRPVGSLSADRWEMYEPMSLQVGMGRTYKEHMDALREIYDDCNDIAAGQRKFADMVCKLRDLITGGALTMERELHPVLVLCTLFINYEGEDTKTITEDEIRMKIDDWKTEGIAMKYFFQFALSSIPGFAADCALSTQGIFGKRQGDQNSQTDQKDTSNM